MGQTPDISVIIPVLNNAEGLEQAVAALRAQSLPQERFEIIVVDNGSSDETRKTAAGLGVTLLVEEKKRSPYAARNLALEAAAGEILAFTDSDCIPASDWLEQGLRYLEEEEADLVGGLVEFHYSDRQTAAERYDALINLEVRENVRQKGVAKTGNLFVRRKVFDAVGEFLPDVRSGGDVEWTGRATRAGFKLVFGEEAVVDKRARRLGPLLKKLYRVGKGQPVIWKSEGKGTMASLWRILYDLRPVSPKFIRSQIEFRGHKDVPNSMISLMAVGWLCRLANGAGRFAGLKNRSKAG